MSLRTRLRRVTPGVWGRNTPLQITYHQLRVMPNE